jgi:glutamate-1-semialdehyde 2,1-aminomutase
VIPDLYTFGKVIGGGLPIGAYGGRHELMRLVAPSGPVYQAGTLSGNPVAVAAGTETLNLLTSEVYDLLEALGARMESLLRDFIQRADLPLSFQRVGSMFSLFFRRDVVTCVEEAMTCDVDRFRTFFHRLLDRGFYFAPSAFEAGFLSAAHTEALIDETVHAMQESLVELF